MFIAYSSEEEMFAAIEAARDAANAAAKPWQLAIKTGDFVLRYEQGMFVFGEILDPTLNADEEELEYTRELYAQPHMVGYRFSRCFSILCPEGELGDLHVCTVICVLTRDQFEKAKEAEWPCNPDEVLEILDLPEILGLFVD